MIPLIIKETIKIRADEYGLDPDLVLAFVMVESSGNPKATRYETNFYKRYIQPMLAKKEIEPKEAIGRATSFGLMQIMGEVAREYGFKGEFEELLEPSENLRWSLMHLKHFMRKYKTEGRDYAIAAYNAGTPRMKEGRFVNQSYVDKIHKYLGQIKA